MKIRSPSPLQIQYIAMSLGLSLFSSSLAMFSVAGCDMLYKKVSYLHLTKKRWWAQFRVHSTIDI